ncbi:hypothetical protein ABPG75_007839 [Micractinium tetrahymenae]
MGDVSDLLARLRLEGEDGAKPSATPAAASFARQRAAPRRPEEQGLVIGDQHFSNINQAWLHIDALKQRLLGRYIGPSHPDFKFLEGLLARHPKGPAKVEHPAIRQFTACTNVRGRGVEFHFVDSAGEEHDFSAKNFLAQRNEPLGSKLSRAMELAVKGEEEEFRRGAASECALCSSAGPGLQVDRYDPPLLHLCSDFLVAHHTRSPADFAESPSGGAEYR